MSKKKLLISIFTVAVLAILLGFGYLRYKPQQTVQLPVLMYHHLAETGNGSTIISIDGFDAQMAALKEAGFTAITLSDLRNYVNSNAKLPPKPILITFDDGYLSNYEYAYPILQKYGFHATIFAIGSSLGAATYKDTDNPIYPHFSLAQAAEMVNSGVISVQSHTWDMHQSEKYEMGRARTNILRWEDESVESYTQVLTSDCQKIREVLSAATGEEIIATAYPTGAWNELTQSILRENGYEITFTVTAGINTIEKGKPETLFNLNRFNVSDELSPEELIDTVTAVS